MIFPRIFITYVNKSYMNACMGKFAQYVSIAIHNYTRTLRQPHVFQVILIHTIYEQICATEIVSHPWPALFDTLYIRTTYSYTEHI
jgi:hypothetical protein